MDRAPQTGVHRTFAPSQNAGTNTNRNSNANPNANPTDDSFSRSVRDAIEQPSDQRSSALKSLLNAIDAIHPDRQSYALLSLTLATSALNHIEIGELADLLIEKFRTLGQRCTADERGDDAITFGNALLSAAALHEIETLMSIVGKLCGLSRSLPTDALAEVLVSEVRQRLTAENDAATCSHIIQAAGVLHQLPARLRLSFLASLSAHLPSDPASRSRVLPVLLNQISHVPATPERQDLMVSMNQSLYQSRLAEQS